MIFLRQSVQGIRRFHLFFHVLAWGLPAIAVIICLAGTVRTAWPTMLGGLASKECG